MMRNQMHFVLPLPLLFHLLVSNVLCTAHARSAIEPCSSSDSCPSLLDYFSPWDSKLSEIAYRFQVNASDILASNSIYPITPSLRNQIVRAGSLIKIPILCSCVEGIRRYISANYTVGAADTIESISDGYGGLVSAEQIRSVNGLNYTNQFMDGASLVIPLPCWCFNNTHRGETTVFMSYAVKRDENLRSIGAQFGTTISELEDINRLGQPLVDPGDVLAVPISACSSASLDWYNESLIVPYGSYALTANNCIKCACGPTDVKLKCLPSGIDVPCYNLQCKGSNLLIGESYMNQTKAGCNVTECVYRGHRGGKILRSILNSSYAHCPGKQSNCSTGSPWTPSSSPFPVVPLGDLFSPSPSPLPTSCVYALTRHNGRLVGPASYLFELLMELVVCFLL